MTGVLWNGNFSGINPSLKKYLHRLQEMGITKLDIEKNITNPKSYKYKWVLTHRASMLIKLDKKLKELWDKGDLKEFYDQVKKINLIRI